MNNRVIRRVLALALVLTCWVVPACAGGQHKDFAHSPQVAVGSEPGGPRPFVGECFDRTELFFGSAKPDGSAVTEEKFKEFLDREITPRFPDGLTLLTGFGQFQDTGGSILQERSMLLILLYPEKTRRDSSTKIEQIRQAYREAFQQQSVLRADRRCERVGF